jgi:hypothetical protein
VADLEKIKAQVRPAFISVSNFSQVFMRDY